MNPSHASAPYPQIGGNVALDFVNSVDCRGQARERDLIGSYDRLLDWAQAVGLLAPGVAQALHEQASRHPEQAAAVWRDAENARDEALQLLLSAALHQPIEARAAKRIDTRYRAALRHRSLAPVDASWQWHWCETDLRLPLWLVLEATVDLLTSPQMDRLRVCDNPPCDWLFLDLSRNGLRRWCDAGTCGNLTKVRRYRASQRNKATA